MFDDPTLAVTVYWNCTPVSCAVCLLGVSAEPRLTVVFLTSVWKNIVWPFRPGKEHEERACVIDQMIMRHEQWDKKQILESVKRWILAPVMGRLLIYGVTCLGLRPSHRHTWSLASTFIFCLPTNHPLFSLTFISFWQSPLLANNVIHDNII